MSDALLSAFQASLLTENIKFEIFPNTNQAVVAGRIIFALASVVSSANYIYLGFCISTPNIGIRYFKILDSSNNDVSGEINCSSNSVSVRTYNTSHVFDIVIAYT